MGDTIKTTTPNTTKAEIYTRLAALGVASATVSYDGACDSGCIESVALYDGAGDDVTLDDQTIDLTLKVSRWNAERQCYDCDTERQSMPIRRAIEHWCYELLAEHFHGWEVDDGACGEIDLCIAAGTGSIEHKMRLTEYEHSSVEV